MRTGAIVGALLVALTGCDVTDVNFYRCLDPDPDHLDATGKPDPCHRHDAIAGDAGVPEDAGTPCPGVCVELADAEWIGPQLVWIGDEADAPPCPANADQQHAALRRPPQENICDTTCSCAPPAGSCTLPATVTASSLICHAPGAVHTSFDPPASWSGACTDANPIPLGQLCGGVPCVQSVTIAPLVMTVSDCAPFEKPAPPQPPRGTFARLCTATPFSPCDGHHLCVPPAPGPEFKQCVFHEGNPKKDCPSSYPDKSVFYEKFVDNRTCASCTCGAPGTMLQEKSTCVSSIELFPDPGCAAAVVGPTVLSVDATGPVCVDIAPAGSALQSKSASAPTYTPGTCEAGGRGAIDAISTYVICCQGAQ